MYGLQALDCSNACLSSLLGAKFFRLEPAILRLLAIAESVVEIVAISAMVPPDEGLFKAFLIWVMPIWRVVASVSRFFLAASPCAVSGLPSAFSECARVSVAVSICFPAF